MVIIYSNLGPRRENEYGIELTFAQNYLARWQFIDELASKLEAGGGKVVSCLGSGYFTPDLDDIQLQKPSFIPFFIRAAWQYSSLGDLMMTSFAKQYPKVGFFHLTPGTVATNSAANQNFPFIIVKLWSLLQPFIADPPEKIASVIYDLFTNPKYAASNTNALLISPKGKVVTPGSFVNDDNAQKLHRATRDILLKFK
jgi:hypothetical protein